MPINKNVRYDGKAQQEPPSYWDPHTRPPKASLLGPRGCTTRQCLGGGGIYHGTLLYTVMFSACKIRDGGRTVSSQTTRQKHVIPHIFTTYNVHGRKNCIPTCTAENGNYGSEFITPIEARQNHAILRQNLIHTHTGIIMRHSLCI